VQNAEVLLPQRAVELWPHQCQALAAVHGAVQRGQKSGLLVMPTGAGKTVTFLTVSQELAWPTLTLVHRDELVQQTVKTAARAWPGARVGVIQGTRDEWRGRQDLVVGSVQSLHARRLAGMPRDRFPLVVVDEAHHTPAQTYLNILSHFQSRFLLGVTATPKRLDGVGLADWFGPEPLYTYSIRQAIRDGVLVDVSQFKVQTGVDLDAVESRGGDFAEAALADAVNTPARNKALVEAYLERAADRRAIVFAVDLDHVAALALAFREAGVPCVTVTGKDPLEARRRALADFAAGLYRVLVNCQVATEGFDDPEVSCILMARPTQSRSLYVQCVGRGLRRCDATGKRDCLIIDATDNCKRHKLVTATSLLSEEEERGQGDDDEEREEGTPEKRERPESDQPIVWRLEQVSPWPELPNLEGYVPSRAWHGDPASPSQVRFLASFGLDVTRALTKGEATFLLDRAVKLDAEFPIPATPRQEQFLRRAGAWRPGTSKREAGRLIGALKAATTNGTGFRRS
jgi:superfamily II DNA or RNA helicase